jgi:hypothetical protein
MSVQPEQGRKLGNLTRTVKRHEIIDHLRQFRQDIDGYIYTLPGIIMGIPCTDVINMSLNLTRHIELLKGALIEAMLREGLSPYREGDLSTAMVAHSLNSGAQGQVPMFETYLDVTSQSKRGTERNLYPHPSREQIQSWQQQNASSAINPLYQNHPDRVGFHTPTRPPRSVDSLFPQLDSAGRILSVPLAQSTPIVLDYSSYRTADQSLNSSDAGRVNLINTPSPYNEQS